MNSFLVEASVFIQVGIMLFAIIACRRCKLNGVRILAAAAVISALHDILHVVLQKLTHQGNESLMPYWVALQYLPFVAMGVALSGWCVLVFNRKHSR